MLFALATVSVTTLSPDKKGHNTNSAIVNRKNLMLSSVFHCRVNTTPNSGKKRRIDCMENDLLDSAER